MGRMRWSSGHMISPDRQFGSWHLISQAEVRQQLLEWIHPFSF